MADFVVGVCVVLTFACVAVWALVIGVVTWSIVSSLASLVRS